MSRYCRTLALSLALLCAVTLPCMAVEARAQEPPAPENLMVMPWGPQELRVQWSPGGCCSDPVVFFVYRNGKLVTPEGIPETDPHEYLDTGLAPDTPHTYTVQAENTVSGERSPMSARAAETTTEGTVIRVPFEAPTIQDAVWMAGPGTMILLAPGVYEEPSIDLMGRSGITIKGQDPEGVVLEMIGNGVLDLDPTPGTNITLSGVTISGAQVYMGTGDTVKNCVFVGSPMDAVSGGGFVTNSVFDYGPSQIGVPPGQYMMVSNSIFMDGGVVFHETPPNGFLLNNNFVSGGAPPDVPGESEGNYSAGPCFEPDPGQGPEPDPYWYPSFLPCWGPDTNAGAFVGIYVPDMMPDVGAFELYEPYTPAPAADLTAVFDEAHGELILSWTLSPHDPWAEFPEVSLYPVAEYIIYRSNTPDMWNPVEMMVLAGENTFSDYGIYPGQIYYYQVRASLGSVIPPTTSPFPIVSLPTNTVVTDPPSGLSGSATDSTVDLGWAPPQYSPGPWEYNVYRNGKLITPFPIPDTFFTDAGLAPETPHIYTVQAVTPDCPYPPGCGLPPGGITTTMSESFGIATAPGIVLRVPQDYPSIQAAVMAAVPGTSIHVGPGIYPEDIWTMGNSQIAIIGQDPQGVLLDLSGTASLEVYLDGTNNTLAGFTIVGGGVRMGEGDTVSNCVFRDSPIYAIVGGGFVTNSVFDGYYSSPWPSPPVQVDTGEFLLVANSVFLDNGVNPFSVMPPPPPPMEQGGIFLLNNAFMQFDFMILPGKGNFHDWPAFRVPGPPDTYVIEGGMSIDSGVDVGLPFVGLPDVGAFELGLPYTPEPPADLAAVWDGIGGAVSLNWAPSADDPILNPGTLNPIMEYLVYRSETPDFLPPNDYPIVMVPPGVVEFQDSGVVPGVTYYYQVRANSGGPVPPDGILSLPTNTASVTPGLPNAPPVLNPIGAQYVSEGESLTIPISSYDPDIQSGDTLTLTVAGMPSFCTFNGIAMGTAEIICDPDYTHAGTYGITVTVKDSGQPPLTDSETFALNVLDVPLLLVDAITMSIVSEGGLTHAEARVDVVDELGAPAPGTLTVLGTFSGLANHLSGSSNDMGGWGLLVSLSDIYPSGEFCVLVDDVRVTGYEYVPDPAQTPTCISFVNQPPVADDQAVITNEDNFVAVTPTASDAEGETPTYSVATGPANGTLSGTAPDLTYTPDDDYFGPDSFTFTASDSFATSQAATVTITVAPVHDPPVGVEDSYSTLEETLLTVPAPGVLENDSDVDGDILTASLISGPLFGDFTLNPDGSFTYLPAYNSTATFSFTYKVCDPSLLCSPEIVSTIVVVNVVDIVVDSITITEKKNKGKTSYTALVRINREGLLPLADVEVTAHWNGYGVDSSPVTLTTGDDGTASFVTNGISNPSGAYAFTVDNVEKNGYTWDVVNSITFIDYPPSAQYPPVANDDFASTGVDTPVVIDILANDTDPNGDTLIIQYVSAPAFGTTTHNGTHVTYTPPPGFTGTDSFDYMIRDGNGGGDHARVYVTVSEGSCAGIASKDDCTAEPDCEWVGSPGKGSCQDAVTCTIDEDPEATCDDGVDNDCDGDIDLEDSDCNSGCTPDGREKGKKCSDGIDNDCDGLVDGADPECQ